MLSSLLLLFYITATTNGQFSPFHFLAFVEPTCSVGKRPFDVESTLFTSTLLQIYPWMKAPCSGFVSSIVVANIQVPYRGLSRRFYLGTFVSKRLRRSSYFQMTGYASVDVFPSPEPKVVTLQVGPGVLPIKENEFIGIFYDKWDSPQSLAVINYQSIGKPRLIADRTPYPCYLGFLGLEELSLINQLKIGSDVMLASDDRAPALSLLVSSKPISSFTTTTISPIPPWWELETSPTKPQTTTSRSATKMTFAQRLTTPHKTRLTEDTCGKHPPFVSNAYVLQKTFEDLSSPGDSVLFACETGYQLADGSSSRVTCLQELQWSELPNCVVVPSTDEPSCGSTAPEVAHAEVLQMTFEGHSQVGDSIMYVCENGYQMVDGGSNQVTCSQPGPQWTRLPSCVPQQDLGSCGEFVPMVPNAIMLQRTFTGLSRAEDSILYACKVGFRLAENSRNRITCKYPGPRWTDLPHCVLEPTTTTTRAVVLGPNPIRPTCGVEPPRVPNAYPYRQLWSGYSVIGDEVHYACRQGYVLVVGSPFHVFCEDHGFRAAWSKLPECISAKDTTTSLFTTTTKPVTCPSPAERVDHGYILVKTFSGLAYPGDRITFQCETGYTIVTEAPEYGPEMVCLNGGFWSPKPSCRLLKARCEHMPHAEYGFVISQTFNLGQYPSDGDVVTFACRNGFHIDGPSSTTCRRGQWSNDVYCTRDSPFAHVRVISTSQRPAVCGPIPSVEGTMPISDFFPNGLQGRNLGDVFFYECTDGSSSFAPSKAVCVADRTWEVMVRCRSNGGDVNDDKRPVFSCGSALRLRNAHEVGRSFTDPSNSISRVGDYVIYACNGDSLLIGLQTVFCLADGAWSIGFYCESVSKYK